MFFIERNEYNSTGVCEGEIPYGGGLILAREKDTIFINRKIFK
jgi:hypothetical protein